MYKKQTDVIRTQIERSQFLEHSTPLYLTSSFIFEDAGTIGKMAQYKGTS